MATNATKLHGSTALPVIAAECADIANALAVKPKQNWKRRAQKFIAVGRAIQLARIVRQAMTAEQRASVAAEFKAAMSALALMDLTGILEPSQVSDLTCALDTLPQAESPAAVTRLEVIGAALELHGNAASQIPALEGAAAARLGFLDANVAALNAFAGHGDSDSTSVGNGIAGDLPEMAAGNIATVVNANDNLARNPSGEALYLGPVAVNDGLTFSLPAGIPPSEEERRAGIVRSPDGQEFPLLSVQAPKHLLIAV